MSTVGFKSGFSSSALASSRDSSGMPATNRKRHFAWVTFALTTASPSHTGDHVLRTVLGHVRGLGPLQPYFPADGGMLASLRFSCCCICFFWGGGCKMLNGVHALQGLDVLAKTLSLHVCCTNVTPNQGLPQHCPTH